MVKYSCERCGKKFSQKSHYGSHNRRKTPCENNADKIKALVDKAVEEKLKELNKKLIVENKEVNVNTDTMEPHQSKQPKKFKFIDESYNANPLSMRSALKNMKFYKKKVSNKKLVFLSDMLELGEKSKKYS